jgi:hypothetical protein
MFACTDASFDTLGLAINAVNFSFLQPRFVGGAARFFST